MKPILLITLIFLASNIKAQDSFTYPVYFEVKSAIMDTNEMKVLKHLFRNLDSFEVTDIKISAYCDERGGKKLNDKLSVSRANAVFTFIKDHNLVSDSIVKSVEGKGFIALVDEENIDEQRRLNRRSELIINYKSKPKKDNKSTAKSKTMPLPPSKPAPVEVKTDTVQTVDAFITSAKVGEKLNLNITFEGGSHRIRPVFKVKLDTLVSALKLNNRKIKILGHIFSKGVPEDIDGYDLQTRTFDLSMRRAKAVFEFLNANGIDKDRLSYEGLGAKIPSGIDEFQDRRVEIVIIE